MSEWVTYVVTDLSPYLVLHRSVEAENECSRGKPPGPCHAGVTQEEGLTMRHIGAKVKNRLLFSCLVSDTEDMVEIKLVSMWVIRRCVCEWKCWCKHSAGSGPGAQGVRRPPGQSLSLKFLLTFLVGKLFGRWVRKWPKTEWKLLKRAKIRGEETWSDEEDEWKWP